MATAQEMKRAVGYMDKLEDVWDLPVDWESRDVGTEDEKYVLNLGTSLDIQFSVERHSRGWGWDAQALGQTWGYQTTQPGTQEGWKVPADAFFHLKKEILTGDLGEGLDIFSSD
jgi:hypothetical protein